MIRHLTQRSMKEFTRSLVTDNRWESFGVDVEILCLPGQPLHLNIRRYMPSCHLFSLQTQHNTQSIDIRYSLPVGIYKPTHEAITKKFNTYVDKFIADYLFEYAKFMQELRGFDHSSRTLAVLFNWFESWKDGVPTPFSSSTIQDTNHPQLPNNELLLVQNAIKLITIQAILGLGLVLETIPAAFTNSPFPSRTGPQLPFPNNQTPRLLNRQIKVVFFTIYKTLLLQVLTGFKTLASKKKSWVASVFVGICLAFLLERIEAGSQEYLYFAKNVYRDEDGSLGDAEGYCREVEGVFERIYRVLGVVIKRRSEGDGPMALELLNSLRRLREELGRFLHLLLFWEAWANLSRQTVREAKYRNQVFESRTPLDWFRHLLIWCSVHEL